MKRALVLAWLACAEALAVGHAQEEVPSALPLPAPAVSPERADAGRRGAKTPTIKLGEKQENNDRHGHGAGYVDSGKFIVKAEGGRLSVVVNTSAYSHAFYGIRSETVSSAQIVQEFDLDPGDSSQSMAKVSLSAKLLGTIRTEGRDAKASAGVRVADAAIATCGGEPLVWVAFAPAGRSGNSSERDEREAEGGSAVLPAGRYILVANLVLETSVDACLRGHAEAVFAPPLEVMSWRTTNEEVEPPKPPKGEEGFRFGFVVTVNASAAGPG